MVVEAAHEVQALFDELDVIGYIKTTGNRGLHVYVHVEPGWDSYAVRQAAVSGPDARRTPPDLITDRWWKEERGARVFVDFNQNAPHKTVFGVVHQEAAGAQVSAPFDWAELDRVDPDMLSVDRGWTGSSRMATRGADAAHAVVDRPAGAALRRRPGRRHPRCPMAAGVPEDARRSPASNRAPRQP